MNTQPPHSEQWNPQQPPKKPMRKGVRYLLLGIAFILVFACGIITGASSSGHTAQPAAVTQATTSTQATDTPMPTAAPTKAPVVKLHHWTFSGNGTGKTPQFTTARGTWKFSWSCDPAAYGSEYNVIVDVDSSDGSTFDTPVNVICKTGVTSGSSEEYNAAGTFYLSVTSEASWKTTIQEQ